MTLLVLPLACGSLSVPQTGCTSQTAIAIVTVDAGALAGDSAPTADGAPASPDGVAAVPDARAMLDLLAVSDVLNLLDSLGRSDTPIPLDAVGALPEASPPETAGRETAPEGASTRDTLPSGPVTLFSDDFSGGYEVNWLLSDSSDGPVTNAKDGSNPIVTLDSSQTDYSRLRGNLSGDLFTAKDITASMRLRIEDPPSSTRTVRLNVRQAAATVNIFYAVGAVVATNGSITQVSIFKKVPDGLGSYTICEIASGAPLATPIAMNQWRRIKLTISGTTSVHLAAFFEDLQVASFTDDCTSPLIATNDAQVANGGCLADQTGLGIQVEKGRKASVDDVLVTTP